MTSHVIKLTMLRLSKRRLRPRRCCKQSAVRVSVLISSHATLRF